MSEQLRLFVLSRSLPFFECRGEIDFYDTLVIRQDNRIFDQIKSGGVVELQSLPPTAPLGVLERSGLTWYSKDTNDKLFKYTTVEELKKVVIPEDTSHYNKAAFAYIRELPDNLAVVLYWT